MKKFQIAGAEQQLGEGLFLTAGWPTALVDGDVRPLLVDSTGALVTAASSSPATPIYVKDAPLTPLGYQQIVGLAVSTALTVPATAIYALIQTETKSVRFRDDGVAPTAAVGMPLLVGVQFFYEGSLAAIRFIETSASATLNISYYK